MSAGSYFWSYEIGSEAERAPEAEDVDIQPHTNNLTYYNSWFPGNLDDFDDRVITNTLINLLEDFDYNVEQEIEEDDELYRIVNEIYQRDCVFLDSIKEDKKYYIGCYTVVKSTTNTRDPYEMLLNCCVSPSVFFNNSLWAVKTYLYEFSIIYKNIYSFNNNIEIMQLYINSETDSYNVVLKTVWLRIFQRKWKKWNAEKKATIKHRMKLSSLKYFEINGRWPSRS